MSESRLPEISSWLVVCRSGRGQPGGLGTITEFTHSSFREDPITCEWLYHPLGLKCRLAAARHLYKPSHSAYCLRKRGLQVQCLQFTLQPSKCSPHPLFRSLSKGRCRRGEKTQPVWAGSGASPPQSSNQAAKLRTAAIKALALETPRKGYRRVLPGKADTHSSHFPPITEPGAPFQHLGRSPLHFSIMTN